MSNNVQAATKLGRYGDRWLAFDSLPEPLRRELRQLNYDVCPMTVQELHRAILYAIRREHPDMSYAGASTWATRLYLEQVKKAEAGEIELYSREHERKHGYPLPHLAAQASVQRSPEGLVPRRAGRRCRRAA